MRTIRLAGPGDAGPVAEIYGPVVVHTPITFEVEPPSEAELGRRIGAVLSHAPWLVLEEDGQVLGYAYATRHHERAAYQWSVDVSVYVREGRRRAGVGRALYGSLFPLLRLQGFCAAHAGITIPNAPSVGLHEALGFRPVALYPRIGFKHGRWHDVGWWQLELRDRSLEPPPLLGVEALRRHPGFAGALAAGLAAADR
jgi:phosphinothricin acetyltransferase